MLADIREEARLGRRVALQNRLLTAGLPLSGGPSELFQSLRSYLLHASDSGALATRPADVFKLLKLARSPFGDRDQRAILGGEKDLKRHGESPCFMRRDGAAFNFDITVTQTSGGSLVLFAYNFELRFPRGREPRFVRFDLNEEGHDNDGAGLRCHMHPGHDDLQTPAPILHPLELLDMMIYELVHPDRERAA